MGSLKVLDSSLHLLCRHEIIDQHESSKHFADCKQSLVAIGNARVRNTRLVKTEEVGVLAHKYSAGLCCKGQLLLVADTGQADLDRATHIDAPAPRPGGHAGRDVLVQVEANAHRQEASSNRRRFNLVARRGGLLRRNSSACSRSIRISSWISLRWS